MAAFSEHADDTAPVTEAFDYVTDRARVAEWNDHVQSVEVVGGGEVATGSQLRQHRRRGEREFTLTFQVIEHERPRRHTLSGQVFGVDTTMDFAFEDLGPGARVTMTAAVSGRGARRLLAPVIAREMRKSTVNALAALTERLGGRPSVG